MPTPRHPKHHPAATPKGTTHTAAHKTTPTHATNTHTTATHATNTHATATGWLLHHPIAIPIALIALLIAAQYGWSQLRKKQAQRGIPVRPLRPIVRDIRRFALKEDNRPLHTKTPWATWTRLYLTLTTATILGITIGIPTIPWPIPALALLLTLSARYSKIARIRKATVAQMFAVAHGECRYAKGSELQPWAYINVTSWLNLTQPGTTIVNIPAAYQSEDQKTREKFERQFSGTVSEENAWTYKWESAKNRIVCEPAAFLPTMAPYPGPGPKWNEFVLGAAGENKQAVWDVSTFPHALICGPTGSGKSVLQRMILFHALAHSDTWRIVGVDPKMVEMGWLKKYPSVLKIALSLEEGVEIVRDVRDEMNRRYQEMSDPSVGVNHFLSLPHPPKALLLMIDETFNFLSPEGVRSEEGKERDALHAEASSLLGEIARLGRAAGVHLVCATQRPDATVVRGEMKNNLDCRIAAGRLDTTPSMMVLDSEAATRLPRIKGRGMIRLGGDIETFQGYFAEQSWFDDWTARQAREEEPESVPGSAAAPADVSGRETAPKRGMAARLAARAAERAAKLDGTSGAPAVAEPSAESALVLSHAEVQGEPGDDEGEDVLSVLQRPGFDDIDDEDDGLDEVWDEGEEEDLAVRDQTAPSARPAVPRPVEAPVETYQPGAPLPEWLGGPVGSPVASAASTATAPAQRALPVSPPTALPVRPPAARAGA